MCRRFVLQTDLRVITESFNVQNIACEYKPAQAEGTAVHIKALYT
jgi:hypothetical protein